MSRGKYEGIMARKNGSWHVRMSHGTYEWVMAHTKSSLDSEVRSL